MEKEVSKQSGTDLEKTLTISLSKINGLWGKEESTGESISHVSVNKQKNVQSNLERIFSVLLQKVRIIFPKYMSPFLRLQMRAKPLIAMF